MSILVIPTLDEEPWPTLGDQVCDWIEQNLTFGPGDLRGQPARLDAEKRAANEAMLATTDPAEALRHHTAMTAAAEKLAAAEERWLELQEQAGTD